MGYQDVKATIKGLQEYYAHPATGLPHTLNETQIAVYVDGLAEVAPEDLERAARAHMRASHFFPKLDELLAYVEGSTEDAVNLTWTALERAAVRGSDAYSLVADGRVAWTIRVVFGGWPQLKAACCPGDPVWLARRKDVAAALRLAGRREIPRTPEKLDGLTEREMQGRTPIRSHAGTRPVYVLEDLAVRAVACPVDAAGRETLLGPDLAILPTMDPRALPVHEGEVELTGAQAAEALSAAMRRLAAARSF